MAADKFNFLFKTDILAADKLRRLDQVRRAYRFRPEPQMRNGLGTRFLGIVDKITLSMKIRQFADDFDGVLIGAYGTVRAEAEE